MAAFGVFLDFSKDGVQAVLRALLARALVSEPLDDRLVPRLGLVEPQYAWTCM